MTLVLHGFLELLRLIVKHCHSPGLHVWISMFSDSHTNSASSVSLDFIMDRDLSSVDFHSRVLSGVAE
jgi:hypothetical protein